LKTILCKKTGKDIYDFMERKKVSKNNKSEELATSSTSNGI
jgi:hypothetical protein